MNKLVFIILAVAATLIGSCSKGGSPGTGQKIGIYQVRSNQAPPIGCRIDSSNLALSDNPVISNDDIIVYDQSTHEFTIEAAAGNKLKEVRDNQTMAIVVGGKVIYYFLNKPLYSSSICPNNIAMQHFNTNTLIMAIITLQGSPPIPDPRNDRRLINSLRAQRKLK